MNLLSKDQTFRTLYPFVRVIDVDIILDVDFVSITIE